MKSSMQMITIAGALASSSAAIRGDATTTLTKIALMQKIADAANKQYFGIIRRLQNEDEEQNYQYNGEQLTAETIIQPYMCVTAKVYGYNGNASSSSSSEKPTLSYLSFVAASDAKNNGYDYLYGDNDEYMTTLPNYLRAIGTAWAEERGQLCDDCREMETFCEMTDEERNFFASMSEGEFSKYMEEVEQDFYFTKQQQEAEENGSYVAYSSRAIDTGNNGRGRRYLFESIQTLCETCDEKCADREEVQQSQEYYKEMEKLFEESMCTEAGDGIHYIGHTCGGDGRSIELAMFSDANCMYLSSDTNAYSLYQQAVAQSYNEDANGDGQQDYSWSADDLAYGYMQLVTEIFSDEYSCAMGAVRSYDGSDPSAACETLYEEAVSKTQCHWYQNSNEEEQAIPRGYDMLYSDDITNVCGTILQLESNLANSGRNPFTGSTFSQLQKQPVSAVAGVVIALLAIASVAVLFVYQKKKANMAERDDLEEPVFQGGTLS